MNRTAPPKCRQAVLRGAALGIVAAAHLLGLMLALVPAAYRRPWIEVAGSRDEALQLHFPAPPPAQTLPSTPALAPPHRLVSSIKGHRSPRPLRSAAITTPTAVALNLSLPMQAAGYVAGGADFRDRVDEVKRALPVARLPGSAVPSVNGLPFVDPKAQGMAAVARRLQRWFRLPDKHCIDVDVWRNLSTQERLKRHISANYVEQVATENGCLWPRGASP